MNVSLTPELEEFVHNKVATGRYNSASEVIRESLRLLEEDDWLRKRRIEEVRAEVQKGIDDINNGRFVEIKSEAELVEYFDDVKRRGLERLSARKLVEPVNE